MVEAAEHNFQTIQSNDPPPLGPRCVGIGPPLPAPDDDDDWCGCVWGSVYVDGVPTNGVEVTLAHEGQTYTMTTTSTLWSQPVFSIDGRHVGAEYGDEMTISAVVNGDLISRTYRAIPDPIDQIQQVNLVTALSSDEQPTASNLEFSFGYNTLILLGEGSDNGQILGYEWSSPVDGVIGTQASSIIRMDALTTNQQVLQLRVQDNLGQWSLPTALSVPLHRPIIESIQPSLHATDFQISSSISISFNQTLLSPSVNSSSWILDRRGGGELLSAYSINGKNAELNPFGQFIPGELIQWTHTTGIRNSSNIPLAEPYVGQIGAAGIGGKGTFTQHNPIANSDSRDIEIGDLDGDNDFDFVVTNGPGGYTKVFLNNGSASFTQVQSWPQAGKGVEFGDLNGDGYLDIFLAVDGAINEVSPNRVYFNNGNGQFTDSGQAIGGNGSIGVKLGDLDGDGDLDAFVANNRIGAEISEPNQIWLNNGSGIFSEGVSLGNGLSLDVALGDLDNDGDLDAITVNWDNSPNQVWLNNGDATFENVQGLGNDDTQDLALGDLNQDGFLDVFFVNQKGQSNSVWFNTGRGEFYDTGQVIGNYDSEGVSLGDLDGDGDLDAFVINERQTNNASDRIWINNGDGLFTAGQVLGDSDNGTAIARLGDLDGDGDLDALIGNDQIPPDPSDGIFYDDYDAVWLNDNVVPPQESEWLALFYLAGDNNLDPFLRQATEKLKNQVHSSDVRIIVLFDGSRPNDSRLVEITNGVEINLNSGEAWQSNELDSGSEAVLSGFVNWATEEFPAEKRYLTIANHGAGVRGVAWDETGQTTFVDPADLQTFAATLDEKIDIIHFDACLMAMAELADLFKDKADYIVASQNLAWGIFTFNQYIDGIIGRSSREQAIHISDQYAANLEQVNNKPFTISVLDLAQISTLSDNLQNLTTLLIDGGYAPEIMSALTSVQKFDSTDYFTINQNDEFIDLYDFVNLLGVAIDSIPIDLNIESIKDALDANQSNGLVISNHQKSGSSGLYGNTFWDFSNAHGLSIYFPAGINSQHYSDYTSASYPFSTESKWIDLLTYAVGEPTLPPSSGGDDENAPTLTDPLPPVVYISSTSAGTVDGVTFTDEDILSYEQATDTWGRYFDGSDVGLSSNPLLDIDAFTLLDNGSILLSFAGDTVLPGFGTIDDSDIVRFIPTKIGPKTEGTYEMYFDGSDVGLDTDKEDIDAIAVLPDGRIIISTLGTAQTLKQFGNTLNSLDEDLIAFTPTSLGENTAGYFSLYADGSDFGLDTSQEDLWGIAVNGSDLYINAAGVFDTGT
ncbi:MAG: FG-GAP-like repeat-containing protein, partial [Chloroflexota bacterium]